MEIWLTKAIYLSSKTKELIEALEAVRAQHDVIPKERLQILEHTLVLNINSNFVHISLMLRLLPRWDPSIHRPVSNISSIDLKNGYIDITKEGINCFYLELSSGRILFSEEVPEEKRNYFNRDRRSPFKNVRPSGCIESGMPT